MDIILDSIRNIIFADILISLVEIIMPDTSRKKYFNFVSGLILAVILIKPFTNVNDIETSFRNYSFDDKQNSASQKFSAEGLSIEKMQYSIFKESVSRNIDLSIAGYIKNELKSVYSKVVVVFNENEIKTYFQSNIKKFSNNEMITEIQIFSSQNQINSEKLKEYVNSNFGIEKSKIKLIKGESINGSK